MSTTVDELIATVVSLLTAPVQISAQAVYPTYAAGRVYAPRDWPSSSSDYPAIFVSAPQGSKESVGRAQPSFTTTETVRLLARVDGNADATDGNAGEVQAKLLAMKRQMEVTLIGAPMLMSLIQQIASVRSELTFDSGGQKHLGELSMEMELEFFENWDNFAPLQVSMISAFAFDLPAYPPVEAIIPVPQS